MDITANHIEVLSRKNQLTSQGKQLWCQIQHLTIENQAPMYREAKRFILDSKSIDSTVLSQESRMPITYLCISALIVSIRDATPYIFEIKSTGIKINFV